MPQPYFSRLPRLARLTPGLDPGLVLVFVFSGAMLVLYRAVCTGRFFREAVRPAFAIPKSAFFGFAPYAWKGAATFFLFFVVALLVARLVHGLKPREVGVSAGDWRRGLKWTGVFAAVMVPVVVAASFTPTFAKQYPLARTADDSLAALLVFELVMLVYFIGWEFFFRGYMLFALEKHIGKVAILVQMIPFAVLHGNKPLPEALGAIVVGILLGYFALATRSFWYCALVHFAVAATMDVAALAQKGFFGRVFGL